MIVIGTTIARGKSRRSRPMSSEWSLGKLTSKSSRLAMSFRP